MCVFAYRPVCSSLLLPVQAPRDQADTRFGITKGNTTHRTCLQPAAPVKEKQPLAISCPTATATSATSAAAERARRAVAAACHHAARGAVEPACDACAACSNCRRVATAGADAGAAFARVSLWWLDGHSKKRAAMHSSGAVALRYWELVEYAWALAAAGARARALDGDKRRLRRCRRLGCVPPPLDLLIHLAHLHDTEGAVGVRLDCIVVHAKWSQRLECRMVEC